MLSLYTCSEYVEMITSISTAAYSPNSVGCEAPRATDGQPAGGQLKP